MRDSRDGVSMTEQRVWRAIALLTVLASPAAFGAAPAEWIELETPRFTALSEVGERKARELLEKLQVFEAALPTLSNVKAREKPPVPTRVYLLDHECFVRATSHLGEVAGVFKGSPFGNDLLIDASKPADVSLSVIYHEYVHYALRTEGHLTLPAFYEEGLAQFAQSFRIEGRGYFHYAYFFGGPEALAKGMPLSRVIETQVGSEDYLDHELAPAFYSRSLLLMHYFHIGYPRLQRQFLRFVSRVSNGEPPSEAFKAEMGIAPDALDPALDAYVRKARDNHVSAPVAGLPKVMPAVVRPIAAAEADAEFGWLLLRAKADTRGIDAIFGSVLTRIPDHPAAIIGMGAWHESEGRIQDADSWIEKVEDLPVDAVSLVRGADLYLRRAQTGELTYEQAAPHAVRARELYKRVLLLDASNLAAAYGFGMTQPFALQSSRDDAIRIVSDALRRFPESAELRLAMAMQHALAGENARAEALFGVIACRAIDPGIRAMARERLPTPPNCLRVTNDEAR
jgi:hypothetical protein